MAKGKVTSAAIAKSWYNDEYVDALESALLAKIQNLSELGSRTVPASVANKAALPLNASGFTVAPTVNDFTWVKADETNGGALAIYQIDAIASNGGLTWTLFHVFTVDLTSKMDKLNGADANKLPIIASSGNLAASTYTISSLKDEILGDLTFQAIV